MYKVKLYFPHDDFVETEMPKIPNEGDQIGFFIDDEDEHPFWDVFIVDYIVYEFEQDGKYIHAEINLRK